MKIIASENGEYDVIEKNELESYNDTWGENTGNIEIIIENENCNDEENLGTDIELAFLKDDIFHTFHIIFEASMIVVELIACTEMELTNPKTYLNHIGRELKKLCQFWNKHESVRVNCNMSSLP